MSTTAETIRTPAGTEVVLRNCEGFEELDACVRLQIETWGYNDGDVIPRRLFTVAQRIGGQVIGAFEGRTMVGFAMSLPGVKSGKAAGVSPKPYLHSHMLAVTPSFRNAGIGRKLKLYQRDEALSRGYFFNGVGRSIRWRSKTLSPQYPQTRRDRAGLYTKFLWCILISSAGWASHGSSPRGVVDGFGACEGHSERVPSGAAENPGDNCGSEDCERMESFSYGCLQGDGGAG
jgi:GNAT superfamily N-acetyltransferase